MPRDYSTFSGQGNPNFKTGLAPNGKRSSLYNSWQAMKQRCTNPNNPKFHRYGGRGITICSEWLSIEGFSKWALANGWEPGLTIDRRDNDGPYHPDNCHWVTSGRNSSTKSTTKLTPEDAETIRRKLTEGTDMTALAKEFGVTHGCIWFVAHGRTHRPETLEGG